MIQEPNDTYNQRKSSRGQHTAFNNGQETYRWLGLRSIEQQCERFCRVGTANELKWFTVSSIWYFEIFIRRKSDNMFMFYCFCSTPTCIHVVLHWTCWGLGCFVKCSGTLRYRVKYSPRKPHFSFHIKLQYLEKGHVPNFKEILDFFLSIWHPINTNASIR